MSTSDDEQSSPQRESGRQHRAAQHHRARRQLFDTPTVAAVDDLDYLDKPSSSIAPQTAPIGLSKRARWNFDFAGEQPIAPHRGNVPIDGETTFNWQWQTLEPTTVPKPYTQRATTRYSRHTHSLPASVLLDERRRVANANRALVYGADALEGKEGETSEDGVSPVKEGGEDEPCSSHHAVAKAHMIVLPPKPDVTAGGESSDENTVEGDDEHSNASSHQSTSAQSGRSRRVTIGEPEEHTSPQPDRVMRPPKSDTPRRRQPSRKAKRLHVGAGAVVKRPFKADEQPTKRTSHSLTRKTTTSASPKHKHSHLDGDIRSHTIVTRSARRQLSLVGKTAPVGNEDEMAVGADTAGGSRTRSAPQH